MPAQRMAEPNAPDFSSPTHLIWIQLNLITLILNSRSGLCSFHRSLQAGQLQRSPIRVYDVPMKRAVPAWVRKC